MKVLIIEDEKITARDLAKTICKINPDAEIIGMLHSVQAGVDFLKQPHDLDVIFSDIELGDGLSFEIFEQVKNTIPIIYCTAFNQYALEAFGTLGIDYLLKPFTLQTVENALDKYQQIKQRFTAENPDYSALAAIIRQGAGTVSTPSVIVHQGDKIIPIKGEDVALFYIDHEVVFAFTFDQKKLLVSSNLNDLEEKFHPGFYRANRQYLINRKAIQDASHYTHRKLLVNLNIPFPDKITVGKVKTSAFIEWLATQ